MFASPDRYEIDHRTMKLLVGLIAIFLASVTAFFSRSAIESISASYYEGGWARDTFVGSLFAISAFLLAYNGKSKLEMVLSKVAAFAAMGVAMFPCNCGGHPEIIPYVHGISAAVMFIILAVFCYLFRQRALAKGHSQAKRRATIYTFCAAVIVTSIVTLAIDHFSDDAISAVVPRLTFYGEQAGLVAFGLAWLTASRVLPVIASPKERFKPFGSRAAG